MNSTSPQETRLLLETKRFRVVEHRYHAQAGGPELRKQAVEHPGAVVIIPLVDTDHVCLINNHRVAVGKTLIELPAGTLEPPEPPRDTAERELQEETGYRAREFHELPAFFMSPGILNERMHLFVAKGLTPGEHARETGEEIENLVVPWDEAVAMAMDGRIEDAKTLVALLRWDRLRGG